MAIEYKMLLFQDSIWRKSRSRQPEVELIIELNAKIIQTGIGQNESDFDDNFYLFFNW